VIETSCVVAETEDIQVISSDEVSGTVMISGAFDPLVLPCKLRRKAGCLIRDIQLVAAELRLTPQPPPRPAQRPAMLLPNPSGPALAPSCCCGICGCGGYGYGYGCCYCGCQPCACFVNHPPCYGLPLGQHPKMEVAFEEASSPACKIM
jgi:hypothetical protein